MTTSWADDVPNESHLCKHVSSKEGVESTEFGALMVKEYKVSKTENTLVFGISNFFNCSLF